MQKRSKTCPNCGTSFKDKRNRNTYCSSECKSQGVSKKKRIIFEGDTFYTREGYKIEVLEYIKSHIIRIKFHEPIPYEKITGLKQIKDGVVQTPYHRSVRGFGYIGDGPYIAYLTPNKASLEYRIWSDMLARCYTDVKGEAYKDATVCEDWHNFQNFAAWCNSQKNFGKEGYEIDKDILNKGNKTYSPENCRFVPGEVNRLLVIGKLRGKCCRGVFLNINNRYKKYTSFLQKGVERVHLGNFYSEDEAFYAYKEAKESYIKEVAERHKDSLDAEVYESLISWEIHQYE